MKSKANHKSPRGMPTEDRFWMKVVKAGPEECWQWLGATHEFGYGIFYTGGGRANGRLMRAHRYSWELINGPIERGKMVLHSCDNPKCVNPAHLRAGTAKENILDCLMRRRHRAHRGTEHRCARLNDNDVRRIRAWRPGQNLKLGEAQWIAEFFGVSAHTITKIRSRAKWKHVS